MSVLIDREELIKDLKKDAFHLPERFEYVIKNQPTVEAKAVVHAEWIDIQPDYHSGFYGNVHKCSNCNDYYTTEYYDLFFCPRCGAKMDGKKV